MPLKRPLMILWFPLFIRNVYLRTYKSHLTYFLGFIELIRIGANRTQVIVSVRTDEVVYVECGFGNVSERRTFYERVGYALGSNPFH